MLRIRTIHGDLWDEKGLTLADFKAAVAHLEYGIDLPSGVFLNLNAVDHVWEEEDPAE